MTTASARFASFGPASKDAPRRVGVIGAGGQLGQCLVRAIAAADDLELVFATTRDKVDLAEASSLPESIDQQLSSTEENPAQVVINAAAYTRVDDCEDERELAYQVNGLAPAEWARQLASRGIRFIHVSTDYVFAGDGARPYREDDPTDPKSVYGASKRAGEVAVLGTDPAAWVVRTAWVFGPGRNFPVAILEQAMKRRSGEVEGPLKVVNDQHGSPTSAADLADALLWLASQPSEAQRGGLLHLRNAEETTWFGFARELLDQAGFADVVIDPVDSSAFVTKAPRPAYSVLDCDRAAQIGISMPTWKDGLARYLAGPDRPNTEVPSS